MQVGLEWSDFTVFHWIYSRPSLKGHSLERTPLYNGHNFLAARSVNACDAPSHQGHISNKDRIILAEGVSLEGDYCIYSQPFWNRSGYRGWRLHDAATASGSVTANQGTLMSAYVPLHNSNDNRTTSLTTREEKTERKERQKGRR